jgi:hypothetical protein
MFKVSNALSFRRPRAATGRTLKTASLSYLPRDVMMASATFFGASL